MHFFLVRQIEHRRLRPLSDRNLDCEADHAPAIRLGGCWGGAMTLTNTRQRGAVILDRELNALLHDRESLCWKVMRAVGCRDRAGAIEHEQVAIRPARCQSASIVGPAQWGAVA